MHSYIYFRFCKVLGVLGEQKNEILLHTKVCIPNPSGVSEIFCISAIEVQFCGSIIKTIKYGGFVDTVYNICVLYT